MKLPLVSPILALLAAAGHASAQQLTEPCESSSAYDYDSGVADAASTVVTVPGALWIQLDLSKVKLAPDSRLVLKSGEDAQTLDAEALETNAYSAMFDGDSVGVKLVAPDGGTRGGRRKNKDKNKKGRRSRVMISAVRTGLCRHDDGVVAESLCGVDDRVPSMDLRQGRMGGCTAWLVGEDVYVTAGHCGAPSSSTRVHFAFGRNAPAQDQYYVDPSSHRGEDGDVGYDWAVGRLLPNSETGKLPGVRQGEKCAVDGCNGWYDLGAVPSSSEGNNIRITGYGMAAVASQTQKTHVGSLASVQASSLNYYPDTTGGNSGSPVIHEETGRVIGVHTHGGCSNGGNQGTRIDLPDFREQIDFLNRTCAQDSDCDDGVCENGAETCDSDGKCHYGSSSTCDTSPPAPSPPCSGVTFEVEIKTDNYPRETSWTLTNVRRKAKVLAKPAGSYDTKRWTYTESYCVDRDRYQFTISDTYGDGVCCGYGRGGYSLRYDGEEVASGGDFGRSDTPPAFGTVPQSVAAYDPAIGAPACSEVTGSCTSGPALLDGVNDSESNTPNTVDGCADGAAGKYHSDESVDGITVSAVGGGALTAGGVAEVEAKVWAWGSGNFDTADFYYTADPSGDAVWEYIGSAKPEGGGQQTVAVNYTLPDGAFQAVRVGMRFLGSRSPCTTGSWDDRDDLAFSVAAGGDSVGVAPARAEMWHVPDVAPVESSVCASIEDRARCAEASVCKWRRRGRNKSCEPRELLRARR